VVSRARRELSFSNFAKGRILTPVRLVLYAGILSLRPRNVNTNSRRTTNANLLRPVAMGVAAVVSVVVGLAVRFPAAFRSSIYSARVFLSGLEDQAQDIKIRIPRTIQIGFAPLWPVAVPKGSRAVFLTTTTRRTGTRTRATTRTNRTRAMTEAMQMVTAVPILSQTSLGEGTVRYRAE